MKKRNLLSFLFISILLLSACGKQSAEALPEQQEQLEQSELPEQEEEGQAEQDETAAPSDTPSPEAYTTVSQSINALGFDLFAAMSGKEGNLCISPYSIETALGMAANGAVEETQDEMLAAMHVSDIDAFNTDIDASRKKLEKDSMDIRISNSAWADENMQFSDSFESTYIPLLESTYGAESFNCNLTDEATIESMNNWIAKATNDKITNMISELPQNASLILFNAVYFNAQWEVPFPKESTFDEEFHGTDGAQMVPFMHLSDCYFKYYEYKGITALRMYYKDSDMAMDILIPSEKEQSVTELFNAFSFQEKQELYQGLSDAEEIMIATLRMPRFEFSSESIRLNDYLGSLGMVKAFSDDAQLDIISEEVYISDILHKTYIRVDEDGTEAAAVTSVIMNRMALIEDTVSFEVDVPFMYYISDTSDGTILFIGSMNHID